MSRWRRKPDEAADAAPVASEFGDVRIVGPAPKSAAASATTTSSVGADVVESDVETDADDADDAGGDAAADSGGIAAELSEAFADEPSPARTTIAIGGDLDVPDAVYLDDELGSSDAGTVFIDDDGTGDAIAAKDATGRGIEPRLRQRRIGVRRAEGRRRLKWAAIVVGVFVVVVGALAVLGSSLFSVNSVDVAGLQNADRAAVEAVIDDITGRPVLMVDTDAAEDRLESIAFVESARVRTDFPSGATIELRERTPVATVQGTDQAFRILDAEGRVLDVIAGQPVAFVLITGTVPLDLVEGQFASVGYASASSIVTKLTPAVRSRLVSMSVTPDGADLRFVLSNDPGENIEVRLGEAITDDDQLQRLVRLERQLDDVLGSDVTVLDVSTSETTQR
ncbi:MAG: cell division protein FtsQ/DivIB [Ilumatobacter sp.]